MGVPVFALPDIPFDAAGLAFVSSNLWGYWPLAPVEYAQAATVLRAPAWNTPVLIAPVSMGNPHGVMLVNNVDTAPVETLGPAVQASPRFPQGVNVGFLQVVDRSHVRLRVYERGVGETLACGTGACAAVAAGIRLGLLDASVEVQTRGGILTIAWAGETAPGVFAPVYMTGPATTVFQGEIELPDNL
jgi:diaminopimelate epimerase